MSRWKKALLAGLVLLVLVSATGSGILLGNGRATPRVIYVYKTTLGDIEFWKTATEGIRVGAEEFGLDYSIIGAREEWDIEGNIEAVNRAIALQPDAIVLAAADYRQLEPAARKVVDAGILLLTLDSDVAGDVSRCFIGTDNYEIGVRMGEVLLEYMPGGGPVAIVGHVAQSHTTIERTRGISDVIGAAQDCELLAPVYCNNLPSRARELTLDLIRRHPDLAGIAATNELAAVGVSEALVEAGLQRQITLITCDHASRQIAYLEQGVIDATIVQKPFNMGYFSVQLVHDLLRNQNDSSIPEKYSTGYEVIDHDNYFTPENQKLLFPFWG